MLLSVSALVFLAIVVLIVGVWWVLQAERTVRSRLKRPATPQGPADILRPDIEKGGGPLLSWLEGTSLRERLSDLTVQSGYKGTVSDLALLIAGLGAGGGIAGWLRTGGVLWSISAAVLAGSLPVIYLLYKRARRLSRFEAQFPDALDTITRSIRAGNALSSAIRIVGEDMPDPMGEEFRRVDEEIRLGVDPGEALARLHKRVPVEDMGFFSTAIRIQRGVGGNLAEVLDRLAEVIRERFKILSYAKVLSAQHRWSAIFVGLSPVIFAVMFELIHPGYFEPLRTNPIGPWLVGAGLLLEAIGFFMIWRIAQIKV
jgi:tight adherence protein B